VSIRQAVKRLFGLRCGATCALLAALALGTAEAQHPGKATVRSRIKSKSAQVQRVRLAELRLAGGIRLRDAEQRDRQRPGDFVRHPESLMAAGSGF
jgi:hypothetical protein